MHNVIQFLETMGANPAMARMTAADYCAAVDALDADPAQRQALVARDHVALNDLLDGRTKVLFALAIPAEEGDTVPDDDNGDGVPDSGESEAPLN